MSLILALGGTGSIGRLVVGQLVARGDTVRVLTRNTTRAADSLPSATEIVAGDLTNRSDLESALRDVDGVVMTHGAPYGSGRYKAIDYGAVPALLAALDGRSVRVALMSSIGVTGTGGGARDLLNWKRRGERVLRASGLPYTIVRPGWFDGGTGSESRVDLRQGDRVDYGVVRRTHVAQTLVEALSASSAVGRTVEVFSSDGPPLTDWQAAFAALDPDVVSADSLDGAHDSATLRSTETNG